MTELKPCPWCGAKPEVLSDGRRTWGLVEHHEGCLFPTFPKHEIAESDFEAWNTRAPVEYDGWFYLPKPKEGFVQYGEPSIVESGDGYIKVRATVDVIASAVRAWGNELDDYVMKRICEVFNPVETCEMEYVSDWMSWHCKACDDPKAVCPHFEPKEGEWPR